MLVLELDARLAQELVHLQLLGLGQGLGVVAVEGTHMLEQTIGPSVTVAAHMAAFNLANAIGALRAIHFPISVVTVTAALTPRAIAP